MKKLSANWFVEGLQDFEYKKYVLLAWLQHVDREFGAVRLYPALADLISHWHNLRQFKLDKQKLEEQFPASFSELADHPDLTLPSPGELAEIETLVEYAMPEIHRWLEEGRGLYDFLEQQMELEPIGLVPLYKKEGYLFTRSESMPRINVFTYKIIFYENTEGNHHGISLAPMGSFPYGISNSYEATKLQLIRHNRELPNPATWLLYSPQILPREETLLPIAKRMMLRQLRE